MKPRHRKPLISAPWHSHLLKIQCTHARARTHTHMHTQVLNLAITSNLQKSCKYSRKNTISFLSRSTYCKLSHLFYHFPLPPSLCILLFLIHLRVSCIHRDPFPLNTCVDSVRSFSVAVAASVASRQTRHGLSWTRTWPLAACPRDWRSGSARPEQPSWANLRTT